MTTERKSELFYDLIECLWVRSTDAKEFIETMKYIGLDIEEMKEVNKYFCDSDDLEDANELTARLYKEV